MSVAFVIDAAIVVVVDRSCGMIASGETNRKQTNRHKTRTEICLKSKNTRGLKTTLF